MPSTWEAYGVDADRDGVKDPYNPHDAIFAAARYLAASGAEHDLRGAVFAYNHADWYVDSVLTRAQRIGAVPSGALASLTGLGQGRLPVRGGFRSTSDWEAGNGVHVFAPAGARVVAVNDGRIVADGTQPPDGPVRQAQGPRRQHVHLRATQQRLRRVAHVANRPSGRRRHDARPRPARRRRAGGKHPVRNPSRRSRGAPRRSPPDPRGLEVHGIRRELSGSGQRPSGTCCRIHINRPDPRDEP